MRSCRNLVAVAVTLGALAATAHAVAVPGKIVVAPEAVVAGDTVRLTDIASLDGDGARALGDVVLSTAPGAGESRTLDGAQVLAAITRAAGTLDGLTYRIPAQVRVRRATQDIGEPAVRQIVERFVGEMLGARAGDAVVRTIELPGRIQIPAGSYDARVVMPPGAPLLGRVRLQLELALDGKPVKRVWVTCDIGVYGPVVVAVHPVARGEELAADDLEVDRRDLSQVPRGTLSELREAVGRVARASIAPNAPLRQEQLQTPAAVHRGDAVVLIAERGALRITAPGEVREEGGIGDQVRVVNRMTKRELFGRVVDGSTVGVEF